MRFVYLIVFLISVSFSVPTFTGNSKTGHMDISVAVDEAFKISLKSNPTTGFIWKLKTPPNLCIFLDTDNNGEFVVCENCIQEGSGGKQIFDFAAKEKGTETLTFEYSQPWNSDSVDILTDRKSVV